jgi:CRP-like cAMP-binding protein
LGEEGRVAKRSEHRSGERAPSIRATTFLARGDPGAPLLTERQRADLMQLAARLRLPARMALYEEGSPARWLFINAEGAVKTYRDLPSGKRRISAFLFPGDIFGLAENGRYVNSAQAITPVTLYRLPLDALTDALRRDPELQFAFLCKTTHELREAQRRAIAIGRRDAAGRLAMFLVMLRDRQCGPGSDLSHVSLAMSRTDIADFLALSVEAMSRASADLERRGMVRFEGRHLVQIVEPRRLEKLATAL